MSGITQDVLDQAVAELAGKYGLDTGDVLDRIGLAAPGDDLHGWIEGVAAVAHVHPEIRPRDHVLTDRVAAPMTCWRRSTVHVARLL